MLYPGRASISPTMDVVMTLLHWGKSGWVGELKKRMDTKEYLIQRLSEVSATLSERPIIVPSNDISFGLTLDTFGQDATFLGSMLFQRCASGARVLCPDTGTRNVGGIQFRNFGQNHDEYPHRYMTVAAAIGTRTQDVDEFFSRLLTCAKQCRKKNLQDLSGKPL